MEMAERVLGFVAEWFDPHPQIVKKYLLKYYCETCEVEMKELSNGRKFLKKTKASLDKSKRHIFILLLNTCTTNTAPFEQSSLKIPPSIKETDFFVGANILLLSRDLKLVEYADETTRRHLEDADERTICILPPLLYESVGSVVELIENAGYSLVDLKSISLISVEDMEAAAGLMNINVTQLSRPEPVVTMSFKGVNSIAGVLKTIRSSPFASMGISCSSNAEEVAQFASFFLKNRPASATFEDCTCCIIKPRAIKERLVGPIIDNISSRDFAVTAIQMFRLERAAAAEFLEVYDGVVPDYKEMVNEMSSGPVIALEIRLKPDECLGEDVVDAFRSHAGPWDENMAREIAPKSIRGMFGNLIHCTDLPKDGVVEVEYFFKILAGAHYIDGWK